jgi:uncharacterized protein (DUF1697 family)
MPRLSKRPRDLGPEPAREAGEVTEDTVVCVAFCRALNVSGKNMIKNDVLRGIVHACGGTSVESYIQSGNLAFRLDMSKVESLAAFEERVEAALLAEGIDTAVMVRTFDEIIAAKRALEDFRVSRGSAPDKMHVVFFKTACVAEEGAELAALRGRIGDPEVEAVRGHAAGDTPSSMLLMHLGGGVGQSKVANPVWLVKTFNGVAATMRNWHTVHAMLERALHLRA